MAHAISTVGHISVSSALHFLTAPFRFLGRGLVLLAESNQRVQAIERLLAVSDEQLKARGTSRDVELQRILAGSGAI